MSIDSVTSYNPNNVNDTLYAYQSNRTVGTNPIQQVPKTNYASSVSLDTPPDTFEGVNGVKTLSNKNKEKGMPTWLKGVLWIGGTAAAVYGAVVGHRALNKPSIEKVAQNFSEIFRRDISKDEAQKMANKYKEIFKIKDKDEFRTKMFEQVKKDFGYENITIESFKIPEDLLKKNPNLGGGYFPLNPIFEQNGENFKMTGLSTKVVALNPNRSKEEMFYNIIHELTHMKQHELAYRLNKDQFFEAIRKARFTDFKQTDAMVLEYNKALEKVYGPVWGKLPKITKNSKEYELATKYLNDIENYKSGTSGANYSEYYEQFIEQEAHGTKPKTKEAYNYFANIWRLF